MYLRIKEKKTFQQEQQSYDNQSSRLNVMAEHPLKEIVELYDLSFFEIGRKQITILKNIVSDFNFDT